MWMNEKPWELDVCHGEMCYFDLAEWNEKGYLAAAHKA